MNLTNRYKYLLPLLGAGAAAVATTVASAVRAHRRARHLPPLRTAERVDLDRYLGTWYEIARLPSGFESGCTQTQATYTRNPGGDLRVINQCVRNGRRRDVRGTGRVVDAPRNSKLKVTFQWPFAGDYWIMRVGDDGSGGPYAYALVGHPYREYLWILAREEYLDDDVRTELLALARDEGYEELERLVWRGAENSVPEG
ncbi:MAG: lipocalin family protein [Catalinimonas sp.]